MPSACAPRLLVPCCWPPKLRITWCTKEFHSARRTTSSAKCCAKPKSKMSHGRRCLLKRSREYLRHLKPISRTASASRRLLPRKKLPAEPRRKASATPSRIWNCVSTKKPPKQEPSHEHANCGPRTKNRAPRGGSEVPSVSVALTP